MPENESGRTPLEVPEWLRAQTMQQQAIAPYCGLGFRRDRLDPDVHSAMLEQLRLSAGSFRLEPDIREIGTADHSRLPALYHADDDFNRRLSASLKSTHEEWAGEELMESVCYGFRAYQRGSYLHNHVDRGLTHIISSTVCVDSQLDEPWPLFIEDIFGEAHEVNLEPGEILFYEGARLLHGRPWPLKGEYYVGIFIHYRPVRLETMRS